MAKTSIAEKARKTFAELTAALEDVSLAAAAGQAASDPAVARQICDRLIDVLGSCLAKAQILRRRLE